MLFESVIRMTEQCCGTPDAMGVTPAGVPHKYSPCSKPSPMDKIASKKRASILDHLLENASISDYLLETLTGDVLQKLKDAIAVFQKAQDDFLSHKIDHETFNRAMRKFNAIQKSILYQSQMEPQE